MQMVISPDCTLDSGACLLCFYRLFGICRNPFLFPHDPFHDSCFPGVDPPCATHSQPRDALMNIMDITKRYRGPEKKPRSMWNCGTIKGEVHTSSQHLQTAYTRQYLEKWSHPPPVSLSIVSYSQTHHETGRGDFCCRREEILKPSDLNFWGLGRIFGYFCF